MNNMKSLKSAISIFLVWLSMCATQADNTARSEQPKSIRIATYNVSLYGKVSGAVADRLKSGTDKQAKSIAAIIQTVRPDILLLNEIDHDPDAKTVKLLRDSYLAIGKDGREGIDYPYVYSAASNTGVASGMDLDRSGRSGEPADAWGFGVYPGQYAFAVLSRYPIDVDAIRTFQTFAWSKLPGALRPTLPDTQAFYYSDEVWDALRLSSKNHVDVPVDVNGQTVHVLACHPTPPVFDGPEDRNGCRNHDEIAFWSHYLENSAALVDDVGKAGGLPQDATFVIMGDLNSDPVDGGSRPGAIRTLLQHKRVIDPLPQRVSNSGSTPKNEQNDTADFGNVGELRVDYVLPSSDLKVTEAKVFWPATGQKGSDWIHASDHRLVWIDATLPTTR